MVRGEKGLDAGPGERLELWLAAWTCPLDGTGVRSYVNRGWGRAGALVPGGPGHGWSSHRAAFEAFRELVPLDCDPGLGAFGAEAGIAVRRLRRLSGATTRVVPGFESKGVRVLREPGD